MWCQRVLIPNSTSSTAQELSLVEMRWKVNELYEIVKDKHNVYLKIKNMVTSIESDVPF